MVYDFWTVNVLHALYFSMKKAISCIPYIKSRGGVALLFPVQSCITLFSDIDFLFQQNTSSSKIVGLIMDKGIEILDGHINIGAFFFLWPN